MVAVFSLEHADPWATDFVDVEAINRHVSDAVVERIAAIRLEAPRGPQRLHSSSLLVLGPAGSGKTHLFARLRKRCGTQASFVLVRPEIGLSMTPRHMLAAIVDSLNRRCHGLEVRQLDAVVGWMLAALNANDTRYPLTAIEGLRDSPDREGALESAMAALEQRYDEVHSGYLQRLLSIPFASTVDRRGLLAWLSGRELDDLQLRRLGLPGPIADQDVIPALRTLAITAAFGAPVVVVFDQLENLVEAGDDHDQIHAHARLVSELFDSVRGLVLVQMALDAEWQGRISPALSQSERDRLEARMTTLELPTPADREALLGAWLEAIPSQERAGYFPWPFDEASWGSWRTAVGVTPRALMVACREAFEGRLPLIPSQDPVLEHERIEERLESQWGRYVDRARAEISECAAQKRGLDRERLISALLRTARLLGIDCTVRPSRQPGDLTFGKGSSAALVFVVQHPSARSVVASLRKAAASAATQNVVLVRERRIPFPATWKSVAEPLAELRTQPRAAWFELDEESAAHLLALHDFLLAARSRDITDPVGRPLEETIVESWLRDQAPSARWAFVRDLASRPSEPVASPGPHVVASSPAGNGPAQVPPPRAFDTPARPRTTPPSMDDRIRSEPQKGPSHAAARALPVPDGPALRALLELRVASVERIVREVRASHPNVTRASVVAELRRARSHVGWAGGSIVFMSGGTP